MACYWLCYRIGGKRVATGSYGLHESVLFGLLTHQLKATGFNGLDGSDHPLKVAARVRIPYGLPRTPGQRPLSVRRPSHWSRGHSLPQGTGAAVRNSTWRCLDAVTGAMPLAELVAAPGRIATPAECGVSADLYGPPSRPVR